MTARRIVVVGASWGGLRALQRVLVGLPAQFHLPVLVVQHRVAGSDESLVALLQAASALPVSEAEDRDPIRPGRVYVAPPGYHLLVDESRLALSTEGPVQYARPSIDVLFESAADACGAGVVGVVLTGTNADGARGLARIKERGGMAVVQDPATAERPQMPEAALGATLVDAILPLGEIGPFLAGLCGAPSHPQERTEARPQGGDADRRG